MENSRWRAALQQLRTAYTTGSPDLAQALTSIVSQCDDQQWNELLRVLCELDPDLAGAQPGRAIHIVGHQRQKKVEDSRTRRRAKHGRG